MSQRNLVSYLTLPAVFVLASLGYSCATSSTQESAPPPPQAAEHPAAKPVAQAKPAAKPQVLPSPPKLTAIAAPAESPKRLKRAEKPAAKDDWANAKVTRYVQAQVLNVRAKPNTEAEIVGRLVRGSQLPVEIKGEWAKIGENQFVQVKYLTAGKVVASK
jgi:hypothetical protein